MCILNTHPLSYHPDAQYLETRVCLYVFPPFFDVYRASAGEESYRGRTETLPVPVQQVQQAQSTQSRRGTLSHRRTKRFHKGKIRLAVHQ